MDAATETILDYVHSHPHDPSEDVGVKITLHRGGGGSCDSKGGSFRSIDTVLTESVGFPLNEIDEADRKLLRVAIDSVVDALKTIRNHNSP